MPARTNPGRMSPPRVRRAALPAPCLHTQASGTGRVDRLPVAARRARGVARRSRLEPWGEAPHETVE
jgi:hypothetical protein